MEWISYLEEPPLLGVNYIVSDGWLWDIAKFIDIDNDGNVKWKLQNFDFKVKYWMIPELPCLSE